MNKNIRWIKLSRSEISKAMKKHGVSVSRNVVRKLLKKHKFVKRKIQRKKATGESKNRCEQFDIISSKKKTFMKSANPIISIDTKKKELLGNLHRDGSVYTTQAIESYDHDYSHLSKGKIVPHGIYDLKNNKAYITIGLNNETAEFICYAIKNWWKTNGVKSYPNAKKILILCDAGGANSYRHNIFKFELQKLSDAIGMSLVISHYPPYTSKWNPIEHRVFPHVTRAMEGVIINSADEAKNLIKKAKTKQGLQVTSTIVKRIFSKGKKVAKDFMDDMKIKFDSSIGYLNYTVSPRSP